MPARPHPRMRHGLFALPMAAASLHRHKPDVQHLHAAASEVRVLHDAVCMPGRC